MIFRKLPTPVRAAALLAALAAALPAAGCGGEDDDASGAGGDGDGASDGTYRGYDIVADTTVKTTSITKPQFVRRANRLCRQAWVVVLDNWDVYTGTQDPQLSADERFDEAVRLSFLAGIVFHIFDEIQELGAPPGQEDDIEAIIVPFQAAAELGWDERWRARTVADVVEQFDDYNALARRYGLDDCLVDRAHIGGIEAQGARAARLLKRPGEPAGRGRIRRARRPPAAGRGG